VIDCKRASEFITAFADGELERLSREMLQEHCRNCPPCRELLEDELRVKELVRLHHVPAAAPARLERAILKAVERASLPASHGVLPLLGEPLNPPAASVSGSGATEL